MCRLTFWRPFRDVSKEKTSDFPSPSFTALSIRRSHTLVISETYTNGTLRNWMSPYVHSVVLRRAHKTACFAAVFRFIFYFFLTALLSFDFYALCAYACRTQQINRQKTSARFDRFSFFWKGEKRSNLIRVTYDFPTVSLQSNRRKKR